MSTLEQTCREVLELDADNTIPMDKFRDRMSYEAPRLARAALVMLTKLQKIQDGPGNNMEGWKKTWVHEFAKSTLAEVEKIMEGE